MLAEPYKQLAKHPGKFLTEKPVSTLLMLAPAGRGPGLAAGRVARVAGKQTLERTTATLPHTALKEVRVGSKDVAIRKLQARSDKKAGERTMTVRQVQKRVDESFGAQQKHRDRIEHAIARKTKVQAKALPKGEREAFIEEQSAAAKGAAKSQAQREYGKEFGATSYIDANGVHVKPKNAVEGVLHDNAAEAQAVADKLNRKPLELQHGGFSKAEKILPLARKPVQVKFVVSKAGDKHAVIPDIVSTRLQKHGGVGTSRLRARRCCGSPGHVHPRRPALPPDVAFRPGDRGNRPCRRPGRRARRPTCAPASSRQPTPSSTSRSLTVLCLPGRSAR
jgi:hypothetical protein